MKYHSLKTSLCNVTEFHNLLLKKMLTSAKALIYDKSMTYFHISLRIIYAVAENNAASTVNRKLRGWNHMTPIRDNGVRQWHTKQD